MDVFIRHSGSTSRRRSDDNSSSIVHAFRAYPMGHFTLQPYVPIARPLAITVRGRCDSWASFLPSEKSDPIVPLAGIACVTILFLVFHSQFLMIQRCSKLPLYLSNVPRAVVDVLVRRREVPPPSTAAFLAQSCPSAWTRTVPRHPHHNELGRS